MSDLISRQAAIDAIDKYIGTFDAIDRNYLDGLRKAKSLLSAQRKTGKWIATKEWGGRNYSCSCCKFSFIVDTCMREPMWHFCPNCGAEMKGEQDG